MKLPLWTHVPFPLKRLRLLYRKQYLMRTYIAFKEPRVLFSHDGYVGFGKQSIYTIIRVFKDHYCYRIMR